MQSEVERNKKASFLAAGPLQNVAHDFRDQHFHPPLPPLPPIPTTERRRPGKERGRGATRKKISENPYARRAASPISKVAGHSPDGKNSKTSQPDSTLQSAN